MTVGYVFDLDRTLVTYEPDIPGIFREACESAGVEPTEAAEEAVRAGFLETFAQFEADPYVGAARAVREAGVDVDPASFAETYVDTELEATHVPEGIPELLEGLDPVGVVTNGYGPVQRRKLERTGLAELVDCVVCADDVGAFKPADPPFDAVTRALDADEYVVVGDNVEYDIQPAVEREYRTVLVGADGSREGAVDGDAGLADHHLEDPSDLATLPDLLGNGA